MEPESTVYLSFDMHPCYKMDNVSNMLRSTTSTMCLLFYIFLGLLSVITICGNVLVILSILYFNQLRSPTNFLILSLAVADLLVGVLVFPISMSFSISSCVYNDNIFCKLRNGFNVTLSTCSILNLCCISIDRYYAVCQPLIYKTKINGCVVLIMVLVSWCASALVGTVVVMKGLNQEVCKEKCSVDVVVTLNIGILFSFYLPVIIMLCIYMKIFLVAQRQARSIQNTAKSGAAVSKMERKATKTLAIVMGVFLMCWTPFFLCMTLNSFNNNNTVSVPVIETFIWLALSNSMFNPFIYAFFYSWFRSAFRMIISGKIFQGDFANSKLQ